MIVGFVRQHEAIVYLTLRDRFGDAQTVEAAVDTGSTRSLTLPADLFEHFGRGHLREANVTVADGRDVRSWRLAVEILWNDRPRRVTALLMPGTPLIGMPLLAGHRLTIDAIEGGRVAIELLESPGP